MNSGLQKKLYDILKLFVSNVFYLKANIDEKSFPRLIFSEVSNVKNYDTESQHSISRIQISLFDYFKPSRVSSLKTKAIEIEEYLTFINFAGMPENYISSIKLINIRESEIENIFQIDLDFRLRLTRKDN